MGHGNGDCGAVGNGYQEAERVRALIPYFEKYGGNNVVILNPNRNWYADGGINELNLNDDDCLIELHLDSASPSARGGHIIIYKGYDADKYDNALASMLKEMFPGRSQTIVGRDDLGNPNRAARKGINYRLMEICFITNYDDITKYNNNLDAIAKGIIECFGFGTSASTPSSNSNADVKLEAAKSFDNNYARTYTVNSYDGVLELKPGANENLPSITQMPNGTKVVCHGYYTKEDDGTIWLCVNTQINGTNYTGYCSKYYLK